MLGHTRPVGKYGGVVRRGFHGAAGGRRWSGLEAAKEAQGLFLLR